MNSVFFDPAISDTARRERLYAGQLFVLSPTPASLALVGLAQELISEAFGDRAPELAQFDMEVEDYAALLAALKPKFIHDPRAKQYIQGILHETECDLERTYFDVPRLRSSTSDNFLTSGIAYAFHPHRDTWYSAPMCQINWWIPVYPLETSNAMAFHPRYWSQAVRNSSRDYNYAEWNRASRQDAAKHIKSDARKQPKPEEPMELEPQLRLLPPPGGMIVFSGAQMHSSVPNDSGRTRFSIDFRTVNYDDVVNHRGATNVDSECTGTTMRDYLRGTDLEHIPEDHCLTYENGPPNIACASVREGVVEHL